MQVPPISIYRAAGVEFTELPDTDYTLCGSLCTVADVLVREVKLKKLELGDVLEFGALWCVLCDRSTGALSVKTASGYICIFEGVWI